LNLGLPFDCLAVRLLLRSAAATRGSSTGREQRKLAAILAADVVGYFHLMGATKAARWRAWPPSQRGRPFNHRNVSGRPMSPIADPRRPFAVSRHRLQNFSFEGRAQENADLSGSSESLNGQSRRRYRTLRRVARRYRQNWRRVAGLKANRPWRQRSATRPEPGSRRAPHCSPCNRARRIVRDSPRRRRAGSS